MIRLDRQELLHAPIDDVFAFVGEFANVERWDPGVVRSVKVSDGPTGVGTRYVVTVRFMGQTSDMTYEVVGWSPPYTVELRGETPTLSALDRITFLPDPAHPRRTVVRYEAEFTFKGPLRLAEGPMRRVFERVGDVAMAGLRSATIPHAS